MSFKPVIIVGAPRSGTNMLRDVVTSLSRFGTWPCDEINYIWRHGNLRFSSDEFTPDMATPRIRRYIRRWFEWVEKRYDCEFVVEKTCANSLRLGFVDRIVPDARYIFIRRNAVDAVESAMRRWRARIELPYLTRKARFVPKSDLPYYAFKYLWNRWHRFMSQEKRLAFWGPRLHDMDDLLSRHSLDEVCAYQWKRCVDAADTWLPLYNGNRYCEIDYDEFVDSPVTELERIVSFLGIGVRTETLSRAVEELPVRRLERRCGLESARRERVLSIAGDTMARYGYA